LNTRGIRRNVVDSHFFELGQNTTNLQTLFEIIVLVGIDELNVLATIEDDRMVLIVGFSVSKNRVTRKLNAEFWSSHAILHDFGMSVNERRVEAWLVSFVEWRLLIKVGNLQIGICTEKELCVFHLFLLELGIT